jgi:hypothetical protein
MRSAPVFLRFDLAIEFNCRCSPRRDHVNPLLATLYKDSVVPPFNFSPHPSGFRSVDNTFSESTTHTYHGGDSHLVIILVHLLFLSSAFGL